MKSFLASVATKVKNALTSSAANIFNVSLPRAAAAGGFILSLHSFLWPSPSAGLNYTVIFIPLLSVGILTVNEYIKSHYFEKHKKQFREEKETLDHAYKKLKLLGSELQIRDKFPNHYQEILVALQEIRNIENPPHIPNVATEEIVAAVNHFLPSASAGERYLRYPTGAVDVLANFVGGFSAISVNFVLPDVLLNQSNNNSLKISALTIGSLFGAYFAICSLVVTSKSWDALTVERDAAIRSLNRLCELYINTPQQDNPIYTEDLSRALTLWSVKNRPRPASVSVRDEQEPPRQLNSVLV